jgi:hypothetical protein
MVTVSEFRPDDQKALDAMLAMSSRRGNPAPTLDGLVERWTSFTAALDGGRRFSHQDFAQAVADRAILDELDECLSAHGRQILLAALLEADRRYLARTAPFNGQLGRPWWQRVPQG